MKFFYKSVGLNKDIERHRCKEIDILNKLEELKDKTDESSIAYYKAYLGLLSKLRQSKVEVTNKIGRK